MWKTFHLHLTPTSASNRRVQNKGVWPSGKGGSGEMEMSQKGPRHDLEAEVIAKLQNITSTSSAVTFGDGRVVKREGEVCASGRVVDETCVWTPTSAASTTATWPFGVEKYNYSRGARLNQRRVKRKGIN